MADNKNAKQDIQIAAGLTAAGLLSDEGIQMLAQVAGSEGDTPAAIGQMIFQALDNTRNMLEQRGVSIEPSVWVAKGGVLDRVIYEVVAVLDTVLGVQGAGTTEFVQALKGAVVQLMEQGGAPQGPPQAGGMPPQGMQQAGPEGPPSGLLAGGM